MKTLRSIGVAAWTVWLGLAAPLAGSAQGVDQLVQDKEREKTLKALLDGFALGVPTSPAFELLPNKPGEVAHVGTSGDLQSSVANFFQGTKLRSGAAVDWRPFSRSVGSLTAYQNSGAQQVLWRTVVAVGTAPLMKNSEDVLFSGGIRIPIIDRGDMRASRTALNEMEDRVIAALSAVPLPFDTSLDAVAALASVAADSARANYVRSTWNAFKLDVGVAGALLARGGSVAGDSLEAYKAGLWVASAYPLGSRAQLTVGAKAFRMNTDTVTAETGRHSLGARVRWFANNSLAVSFEAARIWSRYDEMPDLNESWEHLVGFVEVRIPTLGGWVGVGYGGDSARRTEPGSKFSLHYAAYSNGLLKR